MRWRVIGTDSESDSGVAPVCDQPDRHRINYSNEPDGPWVFDCCRGPHLECGSEPIAAIVAAVLTAADVQECI